MNESDAIQNPELVSVTVNLSLNLNNTIIGTAASVLEDEAVSVSWLENNQAIEMQWVFHSPAPLKELLNGLRDCLGNDIDKNDVMVQDIENCNWLEKSYSGFPPFQIANFLVFGSHYKQTVPQGVMPLQIDAATAFGSGEHGTTRGCLEALSYLAETGFVPDTTLDMGAGSGILAIAAYKLWEKPVLAVDIDKEATRVACRHRRLNHIPSGDAGMMCATGDGYAARRVKDSKSKFNLIIANILALPLIIMAGDLAKNLEKDGYVILSGLLVEQSDKVLAAHIQHGLVLEKLITHGEWRTLILRKP